MKKYLLIFALALAIVGCSSEQRDLYKKVDSFIESLNGVYESYGLAGMSHAEYTTDRHYKIAPIGRLINVRIESPEADADDYEKLRNKIEKHFKNDRRVNKVYICGGGTIMVDCRN